MSPAQKLRIVQALQRRGEVVAMTGDGVNDGPALRAADVGVAMGQRGTDVAREAAAIVLLDDRFASLVEAVRAGRRIFANLRKAMGYLFAVHVPIVGLSLLPLLGGPVLLLPIHVVLLELIIDPACSLVFEAEPAAARPHARTAASAGRRRLFDVAAVARALLVGAVGARGRRARAVAGRAASLLRRSLATGRPGHDRRRQSRHAAVVPRASRGAGRAATAPSTRLSSALPRLGGLLLLSAPLRRTFGLAGRTRSAAALAALGPAGFAAAWRLLRAAPRLNP